MSLSYDAVRQVKNARPKWQVGLLSAAAFGDLTRVEADFLAVHSNMVTPGFVRRVHRAGKTLQVWTVNDLVYNPAQTRLLARAQAAGASVIGGLGMLVHQGALAFEMWTGQAAPTDVMHVAAEWALGQGSPEGAGTEN
jgi:shikimate 5-dehydrogenase